MVLKLIVFQNVLISLSCGNLQIPSKDFIEKSICQTVDKIANVATKHCLENTLRQYNKRQLKTYQ